MPFCVRCKQDLPESRFPTTTRKLASGEYKTYLGKTSCMSCYRHKWLMKEENRETHRKGNRNWYKENPVKAKNQRLRKYGIDLDVYNLMREAQNYCCAICKRHEADVEQGHAKTPATALHVDHCHSTNQVRGLLCTNCNTMIGKSKDDPVVLKSAAQYIEESILNALTKKELP